MKILVVGSKSVHLSSYLSSLGKKGLNASFLAEESCNFQDVEKEYVVSFRSRNPIRWIKENRKLYRVLKGTKPSVVHIHQANRLAFFVTKHCQKLKIPVVLSVWGSDVLLVPKRNLLFKFLVQKTIQRSAIVVGNSENVIDALNEFTLPSQKVVNLHYGVDIIEPKQKQKIVYSNRAHEPLYRIDRIIGYAEAYFKLYPDWKLIIAGSGSENERLKLLVKELQLNDFVEFVGWQDQKQNYEWYAIAAVYISLPASDGTSVSVLEAMSAGCIMVLPDLPVSHELIRSGEGGIIESNNENPLIQAMNVDPSNCAQINREFVSSTASRDKCTSLYIELYRELANEK